MITKPNQQLNDCRDFVDAGLCVIPLRLDGSKASTVSWKQYQDRKPTDAEIDDWFSRPAGVAVVCGAVSGGWKSWILTRTPKSFFLHGRQWSIQF